MYNPYDPNFRNQYRNILNQLWMNILRNMATYTSDPERMYLQQQFANQTENWISKFMDMQARQGSLDQNQIYSILGNWANQILSNFRQQNQGYAFGGGMMPQAGIMPGMGMGGMQPNMGMRMPPSSPMQPPTVAQAASNMAAMYGSGNGMMELPKPMTPSQNIQTQVPTVPQANTMPAVKITPTEVNYIEPKVCKTYALNNPKLGLTGSVREYELGDKSRFVFATVNMKKWVNNIYSTLKELLSAYNLNGISITYRKWRVLNLTCSKLIQAMSKIKAIIQKAENGEDAVAIINNIVASLSDTSSGCSKFFEKMIVSVYNKYADTTGNSDLMIKTVEDISTLITTIKENQKLILIDNILQAVIQTLNNMEIYDPASEELKGYLADTIAKNGKTVSQLQEEDPENYNKFCKENCVVVSDEKQFIFIDRNFPDKFSVEGDTITVASDRIFMDDSPIDNDVEFFIKSMVNETGTFDLALEVGNIITSYVVAKIQHTEIGLNKKRLF